MNKKLAACNTSLPATARGTKSKLNNFDEFIFFLQDSHVFYFVIWSGCLILDTLQLDAVLYSSAQGRGHLGQCCILGLLDFKRCFDLQNDLAASLRF